MSEYQGFDAIVPRWTAEVCPAVWLQVPRLPSWWARIWHYVFFGVRWQKILVTHVPQEKEE